MGTTPGSQETFQLQWDLYENNLRKAFRELRSNNKYFDVTVATEDGRAQAHRILLSASSPLLADILDHIHSPHPYVYLRGFKIKDFRAILDYVYKGEVSIPNEDLEDFLAAAEDLKIKGLAEDLYDDAPLDTNKNIPEILNDPRSTNPNGVARETLTILHIDDVQNIDKDVNREGITKSLLNPLDSFHAPVQSPPNLQIRDSTASQVPGPISEDTDEETVEIGGFEIVSSFTPTLGQKQTLRESTKDGSPSSLFGPSQEIANSEMILTHEEMADLENSIQHFSTETMELDMAQIPTKDWEESQNHIPMNDRSIEDFDDDNSVESDLFPSHSPVVPPQFTASQIKEKENVELKEIAPFGQSSKVGDPRIICLNASNKRKRKPNADPMKSKKVTKCNKVEIVVEKRTVNIPNVNKDLIGAKNLSVNIPNRGVNIPNMEVTKMPANTTNANKDLMGMEKLPVNIPNTNKDLNEKVKEISIHFPNVHIPNLSDNLMETVSALEQFLPGKSPFDNFNVANTNSILTVRKDITIDPSNDIACVPSIVQNISTSQIEEDRGSVNIQSMEEETPNQATGVKENLNYSKNVEESNEQVLNPEKCQFNMSRLTHLNLTITKENEKMEEALGQTDMLEMEDSGNQIPKSTNKQDSEVPMQIYSREKTPRSSGRKSRSSSRSSNDAPSACLNDLPTCRGSATVGFSSDLAVSAVSDLLVENSGIHDRNAVLENGVDEIVLDDDDKDIKDKLILSNSLEDVEMLQTIFSSMLTVNQAGREWKCTECKQRFPGKNSRKYAEKHVDQAHTDHILHKCPQCEVLFKTLDAVERHKEIVHMQGEKEKSRGRSKGKGIQFKYS